MENNLFTIAKIFSVWGFFIFVFIFLLIGIPIVVLFIFFRALEKGKKFKASLLRNQVPEEIAADVQKSIVSFDPPKASLNELFDGIGLIKVPDFYVYTPGYSKTVFFMYPRLSWGKIFNISNSLVKCFSVVRFSGSNPFNYNNLNHYSSTQTGAGRFESFLSNGVMNLSLDAKPLGSFNFLDKKIYSSEGKSIGNFTAPELTSLKSVGGINLEIKCEIFFSGEKAAEIQPQPSTVQRVEALKDALISNKNIDIPLFQKIKASSEAELSMIFGFGIAEYALMDTASR